LPASTAPADNGLMASVSSSRDEAPPHSQPPLLPHSNNDYNFITSLILRSQRLFWRRTTKRISKHTMHFAVDPPSLFAHLHASMHTSCFLEQSYLCLSACTWKKHGGRFYRNLYFVVEFCKAYLLKYLYPSPALYLHHQFCSPSVVLSYQVSVGLYTFGFESFT